MIQVGQQQLNGWTARYNEEYGNTIITNEWYRDHRKQVRGIVKSVILDRKGRPIESVFVGGTYLL